MLKDVLKNVPDDPNEYGEAKTELMPKDEEVSKETREDVPEGVEVEEMCEVSNEVEDVKESDKNVFEYVSGVAKMRE